MRKLILFGILFIGFDSFAQNVNSGNDTIHKFNFSFIKDSPKLSVFSFENYNYSSNENTFSVYNPLTGFNDNYVKGRDSYFSIHSTMSKPNIWAGEKRDSFNPSGATNIGTAVIVGVLNSIFN